MTEQVNAGKEELMNAFRNGYKLRYILFVLYAQHMMDAIQLSAVNQNRRACS